MDAKHAREGSPGDRPSTWCWDAKGGLHHSHPDEDAVKNAAPKRAWNPFPNMSSRTLERGGSKENGEE
eukprot:2716166-Pyramimonas_sp.AAC.1